MPVLSPFSVPTRDWCINSMSNQEAAKKLAKAEAKAAAKKAYGSDSLNGKKVSVQGVGQVGMYLVDHLVKEGAKVCITDINRDKLAAISKKTGATVVELDDIYDQDVDIYAPCALGATVNDDSIYKLKAKIIAGAANNQLKDEVKHGEMLKERGIAYAPDFLINAGGIINVYAELEGYGKAEIMRKTENIYNTTLEIFKHSENNNSTTHNSALSIALNRIETRKKEANK